MFSWCCALVFCDCIYAARQKLFGNHDFIMYSAGSGTLSAIYCIGESCVFAGGIFGVSLYVRGEVQRINTKIDKLLK